MKVDDDQDNADRCICPGCPTYDDCMRGKDERLFCARGSTPCGPKAHGCICGDCPVWAQYRLDSYYFCMEGAAS